MMDESPADARLERAIAEWTAHAPPADFVDRVLDARRPRRALWTLAAAAVICVAIGGWWWSGTGQASRRFDERATVQLGSVGVVVAEPGSHLRWSFDRASADITQSEGVAFYRLESSGPGGSHRIQTPAGVVESDGGCFSVEVEMTAGLKGALVGAALASGVWLTVHQGTAHSASSDGQPRLIQAGERVALRTPEPVIEAPAPAPAAPETQATRVERNVEPAAADVIAERDALRARIKRLKRKLAEQASALEHHLGEALPFPDDLDPLYREDALMQHFSDALAQIGADGEVTEIDCSEFPCIVYGKVRGEDGTDMRRLHDADALQAYGKGIGNSSVWGGKTVKNGEPSESAVFGIAAYPKDQIADEAMLQKRLRVRHQAYWEAEREGLHDE